MSSAFDLTTPPRNVANKSSNNLTLLASPMFMESPLTPPRKKKQEFVCELWSALTNKCNEIIEKSSLTFTELCTFLRDKTVLELTCRYWVVLQSFVKNTRLEKKDMKLEARDARIILSSLMINSFPEEVLNSKPESMDPVTENCYHKAKEVITEIFKFQCKDETSISHLQCVDKVRIIEDFIRSFKGWQVQDRKEVMESLKVYYEEWLRSKHVVCQSSMNEAQRVMVLNTMNQSLEQTKTKMYKLVGKEEADDICEEIEANIDEKEIEQKMEKNISTPQIVKNDNNQNHVLSTSEKLRAYGIPSKLRTGRFNSSMCHNQETTEKEKENEKEKSDNQWINLDVIMQEEGSKKYWIDFEFEIAARKFHRLFELLNELLSRIKAIAPETSHSLLDDIMDVSFIQHTIEHGTLDATQFYSVFNAIWEILKSLHAAVNDKQWIEWHDTIVQDMAATDATWSKLLPAIFNRFLMKLDEIEQAIEQHQSILKQESKFKHK